MAERRSAAPGAARRVRLDAKLVADGLAPTRSKAEALIRAGEVLVDDAPVDKPGTLIAAGAHVRLRSEVKHFVSRGGEKLAGALADLGVEPSGRACLDVGASTGGFTDCLLAHGARSDDGRSYAQASLFLSGTPIGPIDMRGRRPDDPNDVYTHQDRRELRGLYVLMSWLNSWDTKDHQSLDTWIEGEAKDSTGAVRHHLLDLGASLGAAAGGPKKPRTGFENRVDWGWIGKRLIGLGLVGERDALDRDDVPARIDAAVEHERAPQRDADGGHTPPAGT